MLFAKASLIIINLYPYCCLGKLIQCKQEPFFEQAIFIPPPPPLELRSRYIY